ncbi:MAG: ExbD/TolR family protein, partial [bacterium]
KWQEEPNMSGSMLMRLIDVVLIILFGFIGISDIQNKTQLKLPGQSVDEPTIEEPLQENVFVQVIIHEASRGPGEFEIVVDGASPVNLNDVAELRQRLRALDSRFKQTNQQMIVIIDPTEEVTMQRTVDIFDLCEQEDFVKSIDFLFTNEQV